MPLEELTERSLVGKVQPCRNLLDTQIGRDQQIACFTVNQFINKCVHRLSSLCLDYGCQVLRRNVHGLCIESHLMLFLKMIHQQGDELLQLHAVPSDCHPTTLRLYVPVQNVIQFQVKPDEGILHQFQMVQMVLS